MDLDPLSVKNQMVLGKVVLFLYKKKLIESFE